MKERHGPHVHRSVLGALSIAVVGLLVAGCAGEGADVANDSTDLDAALQQGGELTYWTWTLSAEEQVAAFEEEYPNVDVTVVNAGTGTEEYTKIQNALKAGSGAPDVAQIEYYAIPQFALSDSLVDLTAYGLDELEELYTPSTWNSVNVGGALYGLPQDSGPMVMFYNQAVFSEFEISVPTTWDEYAAAAEKLHTADPTKFIAADAGEAGTTTSMIWQAGGHPFTVNGTEVAIALDDEGSKKWAENWDRLMLTGALADTPAWSDEWFKALGDGTIATLVTGAWMPGSLESSAAEAAGDWRVAPMPTYDGEPATAENGGGGQAVLKQSKNPALAAAFLQWLNSDPTSLQIALDYGGFPSTMNELESDEFVNQEWDYFGGQKINEVLTEAATQVVDGWSYLPYQVYANSIFGDTVGQSYVKRVDLAVGLDAWQDELMDYGRAQGFTIIE